MSVDHPNIIASGAVTASEDAIDTISTLEDWGGANPSDGESTMELLSCHASIGFGMTPNKYELKYVPKFFTGGSLPSMGESINKSIGSLSIIGDVVHADIERSSNGSIVSFSVEDTRKKDLNKWIFDTIGIYGDGSTTIDNIIDVRRYIKNKGGSSSIIANSLDLIDNEGATYEQIYEAAGGAQIYMPLPEVISSKRRWRIHAQPLGDLLNRIFGETGFDYYFANGSVKPVNRRTAQNITTTSILDNTGISEVSRRLGSDKANEPTKVYVWGGQKEGIIGVGGDFSPVEGV